MRTRRGRVCDKLNVRMEKRVSGWQASGEERRCKPVHDSWRRLRERE